MPSITVRNLDDDLKQRLKEQAEKHGCSMEEEVRRILAAALPPQSKVKSLEGQETTGTGLDLVKTIQDAFQSVGWTDEERDLFFRSIEEMRHPERYKQHEGSNEKGVTMSSEGLGTEIHDYFKPVALTEEEYAIFTSAFERSEAGNGSPNTEGTSSNPC